jgi:hypothetical protein
MFIKEENAKKKKQQRTKNPAFTVIIHTLPTQIQTAVQNQVLNASNA